MNADPCPSILLYGDYCADESCRVGPRTRCGATKEHIVSDKEFFKGSELRNQQDGSHTGG